MIKLTLVLCISVITATLGADTVKCKEGISHISGAFGDKLEIGQFSSNTFTDFNMTISQFNNLDTKTQKEIFLKVRPLVRVAAETYSDVAGYLDYINGNPSVEEKNPGVTQTVQSFLNYLEKYCFSK